VSLVTRCPVCTTAFRVRRAQLASRAGRVRCGKCGTVFDGVASLGEDGGAPELAPPRPPKKPVAAKAEPLPPFLADEAPGVRHTLLWGLLALVAAGALAAQIVFHYRTEVAVVAPAARPVLEAACGRLGCDVPLPRRPQLMAIESSDLQADPQRDPLIVLNAVLRNRAPFAQQYPSLELTLTDESGRAVLRRVLAPADFLERGAAAGEGIPGGAEASLRVHLDTGRTHATGYRLYLFYP
jgi:predicted Zn finger-like uncharacterized protein